MADQPADMLNQENPQERVHNAARPLVTVNRTRNHNQLVHVRDRLFHSLFYRVALAYARAFPKPVRRFIEFIMLIKAFTAFFVLVYIHWSFAKTANTCLDSVVPNWSREGILRIEVVRHMEEGYSLEQSYAKEERLNKLGREDFGTILGILSTTLDLEPSAVEHSDKKTVPLAHSDSSRTIDTSPMNAYEKTYINDTVTATTSIWSWVETFIESSEYEHLDKITPEMETLNTSFFEKPSSHDIKSSEVKLLDRSDVFIFEYALEYGFLRLSPQARAKLNIPVEAVFLDPTKDQCFGDSFSRFLMEEFLGYNDLVMASVKAFAEKEQNRGFMKNVVTGEQYRFVNLWFSKMSYVPAVICMLIFTVIVSMLLRYAHHQIFIFIIDLLQMLEFNMAITFPTAPLLTVILALVGMEAIMSEFFNDSTTVFYVILIVWLADQYDTICCHTQITKKHWLKFFYLYHFVFYAYHYRFNGQYNGLCLVVHWLFFQHSMIYFFHHYELPVILQQAQLQHILLRSTQHPNVGGVGPDPHTFRTFPHIRGRFRQLFSAVRPSATTQTSTIVVSTASTVATSTVATSTSTISNGLISRGTVTVGTNVHPINISQSIQTMPTMVETTDSQTSTGQPSVAAVSIQTNDEGTRPPHGGPDQP
ncbi:hypothetical protein ABEB36_007450 [Hypothenemus hampei]|uniref:Membralin n=1 Tax=Hypothenemus hampei TaxID=57062 RepID=A0ABD1EU30_HYPHA